MTPHRLTERTGLQMGKDPLNYWRHIDTNDNKPNDPPRWVGPKYNTKAELLADLEDYARRSGWIVE